MSKGDATHRSQRGVSLVEALVALLVTSFGLLALTGIQFTLARQADDARQRGEATRLAQQPLEALRSFATLDAYEAQVGYGPVSVLQESNVAYVRSLSLEGAADAPFRVARTSVEWRDRAAAATEPAQRIDISTVIARVNPAQAGLIAFPPSGSSTIKRPYNRSFNIPFPSKDLGNGQSRHDLGNGTSVVFSNASGSVLRFCTFVIESASRLSECNEIDATLLSGFITKTFKGAFPSTLQVGVDDLSDTGGAVRCFFQDAIDNKGSVIPDVKSYLCLVPLQSANKGWSGSLWLSGLSSGPSLRVCRFQFPAAQGGTDNERNVQPYKDVTVTLDLQNYVLSDQGTCPVVEDLQTTLHQTCPVPVTNAVGKCP